MNNASARYPRTSGCCCKEKLINFCMAESVALEKIFTTSARITSHRSCDGTSSHCLAHAGKLNAYHLVISMSCTMSCRWQATWCTLVLAKVCSTTVSRSLQSGCQDIAWPTDTGWTCPTYSQVLHNGPRPYSDRHFEIKKSPQEIGLMDKQKKDIFP